MNMFKGRAAERAYAVASIVDAVQAITDVKNVEVTWETKKVNGQDELVPVVKIERFKKGGLLND